MVQPLDAQRSPYRHDAFISYSRKNEELASLLENALENYSPPKGLAAPQLHIEIFRDKEDFTGSEYHASLDKHLKDSAKLIVLCSPARARPAEDIIPVLVGGIPNNEARDEHDPDRAFPPALCDVMAMPLAVDCRGFRRGRDRINGGSFESAWYTLLANIYGISRAELEQRDKKRRARKRRISAVVAMAIFALLAVASSAAWMYRRQASEQTQDADQLHYVNNINRAQQAYETADLTGMSSLLKNAYSPEISASDRRGFEWFYLWGLSQGGTTSVSEHKEAVETVAFSPDGRLFASGVSDGTIILWAAGSHAKLATQASAMIAR